VQEPNNNAEDTHQVLAGLRANQSQVQQELFDNYFQKLSAMVRKRLSDRLSARVAASDIVISAFRTFFKRVEQGEFDLESRAQLWRLLVAITFNKARWQARKHNTQMRDLHREEGEATDLQHTDPGPTDVAVLNDELENALSQLKEYHREIGERILMGEKSEAIARKVQRSIRTVQRVEQTLETILVERLSK
jgi:DNA-directed RNA polymerase specialized sigma24 family protein